MDGEFTAMDELQHPFRPGQAIVEEGRGRGQRAGGGLLRYRWCGPRAAVFAGAAFRGKGYSARWGCPSGTGPGRGCETRGRQPHCPATWQPGSLAARTPAPPTSSTTAKFMGGKSSAMAAGNLSRACRSGLQLGDLKTRALLPRASVCAPPPSVAPVGPAGPLNSSWTQP